MNLNNISSVIWITGLSASGKTTLGTLVTENIEAKGLDVIMLDGDDLREILGATKLYTREDRLNLAFVYSRMALSISKQNKIVVIATVALFKEVHKWNRENIPNYFEVFLDVPIEELKLRDPKGIYKKFDQGIIDNVAGLDLSVDKPTKADITLNFENGVSALDNSKKVIALFFKKKFR